MFENFNPDSAAMSNGIAVIGDAQRTIAFSAVASGGTGLLNITANGHALKKHEYFNIVGGSYPGIYSVKRVIDANTIQVEGTFGATTTGNLELLAAKDGYGFYADVVPITIAEIEPDNKNQDAARFIATPFIAGVWYPFPFKKIRITAGDITVVRKPIQASLTYSNR